MPRDAHTTYSPQGSADRGLRGGAIVA
jgi:hypothetical protein